MGLQFLDHDPVVVRLLLFARECEWLEAKELVHIERLATRMSSAEAAILLESLVIENQLRAREEKGVV
jgi:hypothetical protein